MSLHLLLNLPSHLSLLSIVALSLLKPNQFVHNHSGISNFTGPLHCLCRQLKFSSNVAMLQLVRDFTHFVDCSPLIWRTGCIAVSDCQHHTSHSHLDQPVCLVAWKKDPSASVAEQMWHLNLLLTKCVCLNNEVRYLLPLGLELLSAFCVYRLWNYSWTEQFCWSLTMFGYSNINSILHWRQVWIPWKWNKLLTLMLVPHFYVFSKTNEMNQNNKQHDSLKLWKRIFHKKLL